MKNKEKEFDWQRWKSEISLQMLTGASFAHMNSFLFQTILITIPLFSLFDFFYKIMRETISVPCAFGAYNLELT
jgi:hypothetical protein